MSQPDAAPGAPAEGNRLDLLVWDAPNIDATLSHVIGERPKPSLRPRFDAIGRWFVRGAADRDVEACVFTNIAPHQAASVRGWVEAVRSFGYALFARPKTRADDDVDDAMLEHIALRVAERRVERLVVASGDGRNFLIPLEEYARAGIDVVVLSFTEIAGYAQESDLLTFVDLEDVPGAFVTALRRTRLDALPPGGAWLPPTRPLRALLTDPVDQGTGDRSRNS